MLKSKMVTPAPAATPPIRLRAADLATEEVLSQLTAFLSGVLERLEGEEPTQNRSNDEDVKVWKDEEYDYVEVDVPGQSGGSELDLYLGNGVLFARMRREEAVERNVYLAKPRGRRGA